VSLIAACGDGGTDPSGSSRSYRMGFSALPPGNDQNVVFQSLEMWAQRADAAILHISIPYTELLAGTSSTTIIQRDHRDLVNYYRAKGQAIAVMLDLTDGLNRAAEAPELVALGRSLTEPAVQAVVRQYAVAIAREVSPAWLGLAAETNLIRAVAPAALYAAVKQTANAAAADLAAEGLGENLHVSVQVETAWGWVTPGGGYVGIAQDLADFPFIEVLGLSSYPYFVHPDPDDIPADYYARLGAEAGKPVLVVEGGWTSSTVAGIVSSPETQRRYIAKHARLLDQAGAELVVQLTFTDLDLTVYPLSVGPFAFLGLVTTSLQPKPALQVWDSLFALPRHVMP
jgi:hypothetical protein